MTHDLNLILPVDELREYEYFALLDGKKGKGRRFTTLAHNEHEAMVRGELAAAHKMKVDPELITVHKIAALGDVSELIAQ